MLKFLVILLDDMSASYCHYENEKKTYKLISIEDLKKGILFAMRENLIVQFVYPDKELPQEYKELINTISHCKIVPFTSKEQGDVVILNGWEEFNNFIFEESTNYILRTKQRDFFKNYCQIKDSLEKINRLNVVITDVEEFTDESFDIYNECLQELAYKLENIYLNGKISQLSLLTDRLMLTAMNNCNAGWENITLAPDGRFYVCPAFYQTDSKTAIEDKMPHIGNLKKGLDIKNSQLYKLDHAPLCRNCDAYQCKRCIWLNRKITFEVNTPSHEQCVMAHLERNASRDLLANIRKKKVFMPNVEIGEIDYLDPFDVKKKW